MILTTTQMDLQLLLASFTLFLLVLQTNLVRCFRAKTAANDAYECYS